MKPRKKLVEDKPKSENCDCPKDMFKPKGSVCVGAKGLFQFCDNCKRERRLKIKYYKDGQMEVI